MDTSESLPLLVYSSVWQIPGSKVRGGDEQSASAITGVEDLDADFMGLWRSDLDVLDLEGLTSGPADCGLAKDGLSSSGRHG